MTTLQCVAIAFAILLILYFVVELAWGGGDLRDKNHKRVDTSPWNW